MVTTRAMSTKRPPVATMVTIRSRLGQVMSTMTMSIASSARPAGGSRASSVFWSIEITVAPFSRQACECCRHDLGQYVGHRCLPQLEKQAREDAQDDGQTPRGPK